MQINKWWQRLRSRFLTLRAAAHRHFGNQYGDKASYMSAISDLTHALHLDDENVDALLMRGTVYWRELAEADRAIRDLSRAWQLDPARWEALFNRALARHQAGDVAGAVDDLEQYLNGAPPSSWTVTAERLQKELTALSDE
jgi:tetratricopeptide (TPR) repeat protein